MTKNKRIKFGKKKKEFTQEKQSKYTPEELDELNSAAFVMSRKFRLSLLRKASKLGKEDAGEVGQEVHGWLQLIYHDRYKWLFHNDVFDKAIHYAQLYYDPEVFNIAKDYNFDDAIINIMYLPEKVLFDDYEEFEFDKVVILTQGKTFENSVLWIENVEEIDTDGYRIMKTMAPCNLLSLGFTLWDLPVTVLKDAVGMDLLFFEAKTSAIQITNIHDRILKTFIYSKRQEELQYKDKLEEKDIAYEQLRERYKIYTDKVRVGDQRNTEELIKDFENKYGKVSKKKKITWKKSLLIVLGIVMIILTLVGLTRYT